ncbi:phage tail sheath family protein, partial [Escherichia coli]
PMGDVNTLVQCLSEKDAAAFGSQFTGFTIPQALDAIYDHGAGTVLVINVLDPAKHKTAIEEYADPSKVTAADIIGGVNSAGNRTGMKLLNDSFNLYGYFAKILIAPVFCTQKSVAVELIAMAEKLG